MDYKWETSIEKVGGTACVWLVGKILKKKVGENVKMLHAGVFLRNKNENQYSGFS